MLALTRDHRVMPAGNAKISLNEIGFGSSVFAGSTEMLRFWVGSANATTSLYSGAIYQAEEAKSLGLVHETSTEQDSAATVKNAASVLREKASPAFASIKSLLRKPVAEEMRRREATSMREFVEIWYSDATRTNMQKEDRDLLTMSTVSDWTTMIASRSVGQSR
jgi:Delta3-Delta2-enoyl-CoA isomerase